MLHVLPNLLMHGELQMPVIWSADMIVTSVADDWFTSVLVYV